MPKKISQNVHIVAALVACFGASDSSARDAPTGPTELRECVGQLVGPNSVVGSFGLALGSEMGIIHPSDDASGQEGCFFRVNTAVGRKISERCVVGHQCVVAGGVQRIRGAIGNNPGAPAVDVLSQVITVVDITEIERRAVQECSK